jgi:enoyl-CoA hydratase
MLRCDGDFNAQPLKAMGRNSPLSMACTVEMMHRLRGPARISARSSRIPLHISRHGAWAISSKGSAPPSSTRTARPTGSTTSPAPPQEAAMAMLDAAGAGELTFEKEE